MATAAAIIYNLLSVIAIVLACIVVVYIISLLFDKYARYCGSGTYVLTPEELTERQHASGLTKRAGLAGILPEERARVYRHFFIKRALTHVVTGEEDNDQESSSKVETDTSVTDKDKSVIIDTRDVVEETRTKNPVTTNTITSTDNPEPNDLCMMEHDEATCPICLNEYVEGDKVITGSRCSHKFHFECCMQWLEKGNDHCAYCRKDMMKPEEMTQAARDVLGDARVDKIVRINQMAAQRLEEFQAALVGGADLSEVSRQFAMGIMPGDQQRALEENRMDSDRNSHVQTHPTELSDL
ncbi:ring finger domain containing protein [Nitzschia inconspicua]|uniref:Ring finger domain containing protein n=1 Tax=Nitzschia inconspicua TaxID=303405 RepID=A0A9K3LZ64_9STRA|nr:ring finger domain containing protein [Nitzschia inconspicua]